MFWFLVERCDCKRGSRSYVGSLSISCRMITQMHQIILDTATTGLKPFEGHRIVGIGCRGPYSQAAILFVGRMGESFRNSIVRRQPTMNTAKKEVESLLKKLPDDCSLEDIQYHLYVIEKIQRGIEVAEKKGVVSQEEAEKRLGKWVTK